MNPAIVSHLLLEDQQLARKREEVAVLQVQLAEREYFLTHLRAELAAFEGGYLREVGVLYAELDEWKAKIAEFAAAVAGTTDARAAATQHVRARKIPTPLRTERPPRQSIINLRQRWTNCSEKLRDRSTLI